MNAQTKIHNAKLQEWSQHFSNQKSSGLNAKAYCTSNHISYHAFNYWKNQLKEAVVDQMMPDIVPLQIPEALSASLTAATDATSDIQVCTNQAIRTSLPITESVSLTINGLALELDSSVPDTFLSKLIKAVRYT